MVSWLELEAEERARDLAKNWGWIQLVGVLNICMGILALLSPAAATEIAYNIIVAVLYIIGGFNVLGICFGESGLKVPYLLVGLSHIVLASVMRFYPLTVLTILTIFISVLFILEGLFHVALAMQNDGMPGRCATLTNGIFEVVLSIVLVSALPTSALDTIGIIIGANLFTIGICRVVISCYGRSIANTHLDSISAEAIVPGGVASQVV